MSLLICTQCNTHFYASEEVCPHCIDRSVMLSSPKKLVLFTLLGIGLAGCGEKEDDTAAEPAAEPTEPADSPEYGVEAWD